MPGTFPAANGAILTVGMVVGKNRLQCVLPMVSETAGGSLSQRAGDLTAWLTDTLIPPWLACLPELVEIVGYQLEAMASQNMLPTRRNFTPGTYVGNIEEEPCPPQTSMLVSFYNVDQINEGTRTIVGKSFCGPPPEGHQNNGILNDVLVGLLTNFAAAMATQFVGDSSGITWHRAIHTSNIPATAIWIADSWVARSDAFTQKRRMIPLF